MGTRRTLRALLVLVVATAAVALGTAGPASADVAARVTTFANFGYTPGPGGGLVLNWGFSPARATVPSGSSVKFTHADDSGEPHTVTLVSAADVPRTIDQIFNCAVCNQALAKHDPDGDQQPPFTLSVNVGRSGLNTEGDSRLLFPGASTFGHVTAPRGATLHYVCAIHPWMQGVVKVT